METQTITIYDFNELSQAAKEKAHIEHLSGPYFDYAWLNESLESVKAFCDLFDVKMTNYSLDTYGFSYIDTDVDNDNFRGFKLSDCFPNDHCLTGYYLDYGLLSVFNEVFKETGNANGAFDSAIEQAVKEIVSDMEYQESIEYFAENAAANEWQFLESGEYWGM